MRARLRVIPAAVALATGLAAPALAQDSGPSTATQPISIPAAPSSEEAVGPAQLKDFSLQGTVTRRAETPAQPEARPQPQPRADAPVATRTPTVAVPAPQQQASGKARPVPSSQAPAQPATTAAAGTGLPTPAQTLSFSPATITPQTEPTSEAVLPQSPATGGGLFSYWPWLLALVAAGGAALWYFRRQRPGYGYAGAGANASAFEFSPPPPAPSPPRAQPRPAAPGPVAAPPAPRSPLPEEPLKGAVVSTRLKVAPEVRPEPAPLAPSPGIVSARLRPWLDIEFVPLAASFTDSHAVIQFDVTLFNSGSAPARDILLEARLFNAGADQDEVIAKFFANPTVDGETLDIIQPLQRMSFRTSAKVPREQMRIYEAGGRQVWVPLIGFNATYRSSSVNGQTSASYLLGRNTNGDKMAPFRVDLGTRAFNDLGAREHTVRLRN